jgi:dolichyl-phosphate-mannose--protein O-mannosyl transferase
VAARRLLQSQTLGCLAGLLFAVDGQAIVHSRIALLDQFLMFFSFLAFYLILRDREQMRRRLEERMRAVVGYDATGRPIHQDGLWGPRLGMRWWLLGAGASLGLATATKWSGAYFLAAFGILVAIWDMADRRSAGIKLWAGAGALMDATKAFVLMVGTSLVVYVASWAGWFAPSDAYHRRWAETNGYSGLLPAPLRSLIEYHIQAWNFHTTLSTEHNYMSSPLTWLFQGRPTSFFWEQEPTCGTDNCAQAILDIGNPLIWWLGIAGLLIVLYFAILWADRRAWAIVAGYAGGYLPWFLYLGRTVFTFYSIAFTPYVVLALTYMLGVLGGRPGSSPGRRRAGAVAVGAIVILILLMSAFWWPVWTGESVPYDYWHAHMWFASWI